MKSTRFHIINQARSPFTFLLPQHAGEHGSGTETVFHHHHRDWIHGWSFGLHEAAGQHLVFPAADP